MKKKLVLIKAFYKKLLAPSVFLFLITLIAGLVLVYLLGTYGYFTMADRSFSDILQDQTSCYVMRLDLGSPAEDMLTELQAMPAVKDLYGYRNAGENYFYGETQVAIVLINPEMFRDYSLLKADGYFTETGMDGGLPQGIAAGGFLRSGARGENITMQNSGQSVPVQILGSIQSPYYVPSFKSSGTMVTSDKIMQPADPTIFMKDTPEVRGFLQKEGILRYSGNFFLVFQESTEAEKQAVFDFLEAQDLFYTDAGTILKNSETVTLERLRTVLPLPLFLTILATVLTWCFSVLFLHKKMELILTFYLCGCSKKKGYGIMAVSLGLLSFLAMFIDGVLLLLWRWGMQNGSIAIDDFLLDQSAFLFLACYWFLLLFLSVTAAFLIYRKKSVLTIRKKVDL